MILPPITPSLYHHKHKTTDDTKNHSARSIIPLLEEDIPNDIPQMPMIWVRGYYEWVWYNMTEKQRMIAEKNFYNKNNNTEYKILEDNTKYLLEKGFYNGK